MQYQFEHRRIVANGMPHNYVVAGEGRPLLLIHGFPQTWLEWKAVVRELPDGFRLILPNLRGLGGNPGPAAGFDKHSLASDIRAIVEAECGDAPVLICGHDMGGYVGFAYALNHRDGVEALLIVDAPPPGTSVFDQLTSNPRTWHVPFHSNPDVAHMLISGREREYIRYFIMRGVHNAGGISEAEIDQYAAAYSAPGALRCALEQYRALPQDRELNRAALAAGGKLTIPTMMVGCSVTATEDYLRGMVDEIAIGGRIAIVDKSGHWIPEEQPAALARLIVEMADASRTDAA